MATKKKATSDVPKGFPTSIRLLSQTWEVKYVTHVDKGEHLLGSCEADRRLILIDKTQSIESLRDTLVHEILHAGCRVMPLDFDSEAAEERLVIAFTTIFLSLLRENTEFWMEDD